MMEIKIGRARQAWSLFIVALIVTLILVDDLSKKNQPVTEYIIFLAVCLGITILVTLVSTGNIKFTQEEIVVTIRRNTRFEVQKVKDVSMIDIIASDMFSMTTFMFGSRAYCLLLFLNSGKVSKFGTVHSRDLKKVLDFYKGNGIDFSVKNFKNLPLD